MPNFFYQEQVVVASSKAACVEAARSTLSEMGARPIVSGARITGRLGSMLKMRFVGGAFCPLSWLPIDLSVDIADSDGQRQIVVSVAERHGIGVMFGMEKRYRIHCQATATQVRDAIGARLAAGR